MSHVSDAVRQAAAQAGRRSGGKKERSPAKAWRADAAEAHEQTQHKEAKTGGVLLPEAQRKRSSALALEERRKLRRQFYTVHFRKADFEIDVRYQNCKYLRSGAYGRVCSAIDMTDNGRVAIKKVPEMFEDLVDAKRILREIKLLLHFKNTGGHQNIVALRDIICGSRASRRFEDCYIVLDAYECDLATIINRDHTQLGKAHVQYLTYQILAGLRFMHSAGVIHRDLKPANLLVRSNCDLVICDFGLSRGGANDYDTAKTAYVVTRYYRAPELLCRLDHYDAGVDIWSTALIVAEMLTGEVCLRGSSTIDQLRKTLDLVPPPSDEFLQRIPSAAARLIREHKKHKLSHFKKLLRKQFQKRGGSKAVDFIEATLTFDPAERLTVNEALQQPYLAKIRKDLIATERDCPAVFDESFEKDYPLDVEMPKKLIQRHLYGIMEELTVDPLDPDGSIAAARNASSAAKGTEGKLTAGMLAERGKAVVAAATADASPSTVSPEKRTSPSKTQTAAMGTALIGSLGKADSPPQGSGVWEDKSPEHNEDIQLSRRDIHVI